MRRALYAAALAVATLAAPRTALAGPPQVGDYAPEFTVADQVQGDKFTSLKALRGKVVVIDFYGKW